MPGDSGPSGSPSSGNACRWLPGTSVKVAAVRLQHVGQEVLNLQLERPACITEPDVLKGLPPVGMDVALEFGVGKADNGLGHAQLNVGAEQVHHDAQDTGMVHQLDEGIVVFHHIAAVHPLGRIRLRVVHDVPLIELIQRPA